MDISELTNMTPIPLGHSRTTVFKAQLNNTPVIVKMETKSAVQYVKTSGDDRFKQELDILNLNIPTLPTLLVHGTQHEQRFLVMEELYDLPEVLTEELYKDIVHCIFTSSRLLFLKNFNWVASSEHIKLSSLGVPKILDFNDDNLTESAFFSRISAYDVVALAKKLGPSFDSTKIIDEVLYNMIEQEYQSLENVHEPIYFEPYNKFYRRESEKDSPDYMKCVPPNRLCVDRKALIINQINAMNITTGIDIGCNVGWFSFMLQQRGISMTGVDFDDGKIKFNKLISEIKNIDAQFSCVDVNTAYVNTMPEYDLVLVLSILHLYFTQHKVSKEYWYELFTGLCKKTKKVLIFETASIILQYLGFSNLDQLAKKVKEIGKFSDVQVSKDKSDANRHIITCIK